MKKRTKCKRQTEPRISSLVRPDGLSMKQWQIALRRQAAQKGEFVVEPLHGKSTQGYFSVKKPIYSAASLKDPKSRLLGYGAPYSVVYRGEDSKWNFCSCMDFKTSGLGTCKHIEAVKNWCVNNKKSPVRQLPKETSLYIDYSDSRKIKIRIGKNDREAISEIAREYFDGSGTFTQSDPSKLYEFLERVSFVTDYCRCFRDVYDEVAEAIRKARLQTLSDEIDDALVQSLLNTQLFPYQLEGVKFAFRHGRSIIADEMGLGKTIQAIGTAELLRHFRLATSVLVVCPTSLKYQWKHEIERFTGSTVTVIEGNQLARKRIYRNDDSFYKIVSYNTLANDVKLQGQIETDLLIMDEVQRLKNWETQIAKAARKVKSSFTVLLSGTPLENKLEELYSIVELVDQFALSPYYEFRDKYVVTDSAGMTIGYKNLRGISDRLKNILIRRRKSEVALQMPGRMDKTLYVPMTKQQQVQHEELAYHVSILVHKWRTYHFLSEQDRLRLLMLLGQMRMVANSTFILDQKTRHDTKIDELREILKDIFESGDEKVVIFSGWERMTRLIAAELDNMGVRYSNLNGSVPSAKRKNLVENFTNDPECRVFLSTDAGATGLNLQSGSVIINMELPWNPAVHEQRIGRIYRLGQMRNIQVINMVSEGSIEMDIQTKLRFKSALAEGILDNGEDSVFMPKKQFDEIIETLDKIVEEKESAAASEPTTADVEESADTDCSETETQTQDLPSSVVEEIDIPADDDEDTVAEPCEELDADSVHEKEENQSDSGKSGKEASEQPPMGSSHAAHTKGEQQPSTPSSGTANSSRGGQAMHPADLVSQGISFLSELAETLYSPERTQALVDEIVKTDETTGQTTIQIPVADKQVVSNLFAALAGLLSK